VYKCSQGFYLLRFSYLRVQTPRKPHFLSYFSYFLTNPFEFNQNRLKLILYYISSLFNQKRVLRGAYISAPEPIPPLLALLAPNSSSKTSILPANEHEKRHSSPNFVFMRIKVSGLIKPNSPVKMSLLRA
jgi:hypothetical protein